MADADPLKEAWCAFADADTMEEGRQAFDAAISRAARALEETTKATAVLRAGGCRLFKLSSNRPGDQIGL